MKNFLRLVSKHIIIGAALYIIALIVLGERDSLRRNFLYYRIGSYGQLFTRLQDLDTTKNVDILFLGSSHSYRGFDTRMYTKEGYRVFNLGSSRQTPIQTNYMITNYIDQLNPKLVIIETYPYMFCSEGTESSLDIISNTKSSISTFKLALQQNNQIVYNTYIYSLYRDLIFNEKENYKIEITRGKDTYIKGGFVEKELMYRKEKEFEARNWEFNDKQFKYFEKALKQLKNRKTKYILIEAPLPKAVYSSFKNNLYFENKMKNYGRFYNFNMKPYFTDSIHFMDDDHLNSIGIKIFNKKVIELLKTPLNKTKKIGH